MLKEEVRTVTRKGLNYIVDNNNRIKSFKPWLGDAFSFLYDTIMKWSVFPKKFGGDMDKHFEILSRELISMKGKQVLELATGSGSAVNFLANDNRYTGTDISPGLLKRAAVNFKKAGFEQADFYVVSANDLPFADDTFDLCLCILSLNFFRSLETVLQETRRILKHGAMFVCAVPVPERNKVKSTIRGTLYREDELKKMVERNRFTFEPITAENGNLIYFRATK